MVLCALFLMPSVSFGEERDGEHEAKKPPPKPSMDSPVIQVMKLPAIQQRKAWLAQHHQGTLIGWGDMIKTVEHQKCWEVAVGQLFENKLHAARYFCVPRDGGDIWVENTLAKPEDDITYMIYSKWVESCKPTGDGWGHC